MNRFRRRQAIIGSMLTALLTACGEGSGIGSDAGTGAVAGAGGAGGTGGAGVQEITISEELANPRTLSRHFVKEASARNAVCNDGTDAVYYFAAGSGTGEGKWIVHLEGGGSCSDPEDCEQRAASTPWLTSSEGYPEIVSLNGIFADDADLNPDFFNWNAVFMKYCSSDAWRGSKAATGEVGGFHFRGHDIVHAVLEDLQDAADFGTDSLANATQVILSGRSAGGIGVKHNLDRVAETLSWADVRGLDDSAYWSREALGGGPLDLERFAERREYQGFVYDESCAANEPEPVACGATMVVGLSHVSTPYFVVVDQLDPVILATAVDQTQERNDTVAESVRELVRSHGAGFAPRHEKHGWVDEPLSYQYQIDDVSALESFGNWYFGRDGPAVVVEN